MLNINKPISYHNWKAEIVEGTGKYYIIKYTGGQNPPNYGVCDTDGYKPGTRTKVVKNVGPTGGKSNRVELLEKLVFKMAKELGVDPSTLS